MATLPLTHLETVGLSFLRSLQDIMLATCPSLVQKIGQYIVDVHAVLFMKGTSISRAWYMTPILWSEMLSQ